MAKKSRTPPPPRKVQAPRTASSSQSAERRARVILYVAAASGIVALAAVLAFLFLGGSGTGSAAEELRKAGCRLEQYKAAASGTHVEQPPPRSQYNSWPPTSGPHHPSAAPYDFYTQPVEQYRLVHNLEHGSVIVQYGSKVPKAAVDALSEWYRDAPDGIVVAPMPELGSTIVLEAWTAKQSAPNEGVAYLARCNRFDTKAFDGFVKAYGFRGPERFPRSLLTPGS